MNGIVENLDLMKSNEKKFWKNFLSKASDRIFSGSQAENYLKNVNGKTWKLLKKWSKQIRKLHWSIEFCNHSWMSCEPENGLKRFWEPFENKFIGRLIKIRKTEVLLQYLKYWFVKYIFIFRFLYEFDVFFSRNSSR